MSAPAATPATERPEKKRGEWTTPDGVRKTKETLVKRRKISEVKNQKLRNVEANNAVRAAKREAQGGRQEKKKLWTPAQALVRHFKLRERAAKDQVRQERQVDKQPTPLADVTAELVLLTRVDPDPTSKKADMVPPKALRLLRDLKMEKRHNAVFELLNTKEKRRRLAMLAKFVKIQQPTRQQIHNLLFTRGFARVKEQRLPLSDNVMIENSLGQHNIVCLEDMVHELDTVGPGAQAVVDFLWPFRLEKEADLRIPVMPKRKE